MPRTFKRSTKVTAVFLDGMQQYLSLDEGDLWVRRMRSLYCPEQGVIEKDISPFFDLFLPGKTTIIKRLVGALSGGGIIPNSILSNIADIEEQNDRILQLLRGLGTPPPGIV